MTKETVKFVCYDGSTFTRDLIVKDDESSIDVIETFIYNYNKTKTTIDEMCCYIYQVLSFEKI